MLTPRDNPASLERELARLGAPIPRRVPLAARLGRWCARVIGRNENPTRWAFPVGTIAGVPMRMHAIVLLWAAAELVASASRSQMGFEYATAAVLGIIFISMLREAARVAWAHRHAAVADASIIWPLGGLNAITPVGRGRSASALRSDHSASIHSELGGAFFGVAMLPVLAIAALLVGVPSHALYSFDILSPADSMVDLSTRWQYATWWLYYANLVILIANLALVAPCFDAGRVLARAMRSRRATNRAAITLWAGLASACALGLIALAAGSLRIAIVSLIAALTTWLVFRSQTFLAAAGTQTRPAFSGAATSATRPILPSRPRSNMAKLPRNPGPSPSRAAASAPSPIIEHPARQPRGTTRVASGALPPEPAPPTPEQVDAILRQISREGIASLSQDQLDALDRATRNLRAR